LQLELIGAFAELYAIVQGKNPTPERRVNGSGVNRAEYGSMVQLDAEPAHELRPDSIENKVHPVNMIVIGKKTPDRRSGMTGQA
jgi:hypothetical protein